MKRLIRNFLWSGGDGRPARAKVAWPVIILPTSQGGLGIIDPGCQSRALLGKLIVRGLLLGGEPWKELLMQRIHGRVPAYGGPWRPGVRWIFSELCKVGLSRRFEDRFASSLLRAWEQLRLALFQTPPASLEEQARQHLIWSPQVVTQQGYMLGERPHLSWGAMDSGPARSLGEWLQFRQLPMLTQEEQLRGIRGAQQMSLEIDRTIPQTWAQPMHDTSMPQWMGAFAGHEVLIAVRGTSEAIGCLCFDVAEDGRLRRVTAEGEVVAQCCFQRIQIIGSLGRQWMIDPDPAAIEGESGWRLWVWGRRPLARLQWDPGEWFWRDPFSPSDSPGTPFF